MCVDEKAQIQALDRTAPMLPIAPGLAERRTHDYKRAGTTALFAALEVATGRITADACYPKHRHQEFLAFLKQVAKAHPWVTLHVVCDNNCEDDGVPSERPPELPVDRTRVVIDHVEGVGLMVAQRRYPPE